jgi:CRISPR/Cas system-associated exonuclease Cas4 (RecB family)
MIKLKSVVTDITESIDAYLIKETEKKSPRTYLGGSAIGKECDRQIWYEYYQPIKNDNPRVERIFLLGHLMESLVLAMLKHAGYTVYHETDDGHQFGGEDEEIGWHCDGVIMYHDTPHLLEIKSASDKRFNEMVKKGVRLSDPVYYTQMQVYMHYLELDKGLFVVMNKNNSELHMEVIEYNAIEAKYAINRGKEIVRNEIPDRKYISKSFYKCAYCVYKEICWTEP